jgi:hypothetical protein
VDGAEVEFTEAYSSSEYAERTRFELRVQGKRTSLVKLGEEGGEA